VAWVFNANLNTVDYYLDGVKGQHVCSGLGCQNDDLTVSPATHPYLKYSDTVALSGCEMDTANSYVALGHRVPGMYNFIGGIQDFRMYIGSALTETDIATLAADPEILECETVEKGGDSVQVDTMGNSCAWYESVKSTYPQICNSDFAQSECTYTCSSIAQCFEKPSPNFVNTIFDRVMMMETINHDNGVLCTRRGLDLVAECKAMVTAGKWTFETLKNTYSRGSWPYYTEMRSPVDKKYIDMLDCEKVAAAWNPHCSFSVPEVAMPNGVPKMWTKKMQDDVTANGGRYSQLFWVKPTKKFLLEEPNGRNHPDILFFQSVSPPVLLNMLRFKTENGILMAQTYMFSGMCGDSVSVSLSLPLSLSFSPPPPSPPPPVFFFFFLC